MMIICEVSIMVKTRHEQMMEYADM